MTPEEAASAGEVIKAANGWLERFFGPAAEQVGAMLGDWLQEKRELMQKNRRAVALKVERIMIEEDVEPREISSKVLLPILEGSSLEDDEKLQDMWANLFVNYVDSSNLSINISYPGILRQISSNEAHFLNHLYDNPKYGIQTRGKQIFVFFEQHEVNNLERLGLIEEDKEYSTSMERPGEVNWGGTGAYFFTPYGKDFVKACRRNNQVVNN